MKIHKYTKEEKVFIKDHVKGRTNAKLAQIMSETFGIVFTAKQIKSYKGNNKLKSGINTKFKKGHKTHNKGKKFPGQGTSSSFKKGERHGNSLKNYKPIGAERVTKDGYIKIKIADDFSLSESKKWKFKHRLIYEEKYGKLKNNEALLFLDGNRQNLVLNNLMKVTRSELATLNKLGLLYNNDPESKKAAVLSVRLQKTVAEKIEKRKKLC